jgi:PAS domain-containing protein
MARETLTDDATALRDRQDSLEQELRRTRRELEEARARETLYSGLAERAPDAMLVYDRSGYIVFINKACAGMFGATHRDQIIGRLATDDLIPIRSRTFAAISKRSSTAGSPLFVRSRNV